MTAESPGLRKRRLGTPTCQVWPLQMEKFIAEVMGDEDLYDPEIGGVVLWLVETATWEEPVGAD